MKAKILNLTILAVFLLSTAASASMIIPANQHAKDNAAAPEKSPVIGDNWDLERVDFIHYAKPSGGSKPGTDLCYKLMGVKWTTLPVSYLVNPANPQGLNESFVLSALTSGAEAWDTASESELFNAPVVDYAAQYGVQNYKNAVVFGDYPDSNVIGVTSVWYTKVGKRIVEFDMLLNTRFSWGDATVNPAVMDLQNIATHEFGHSVGMSDIYSTSCTAVTMYGYSSNG
ncbi:MAG: hypothetical protein QXM31_04440, partial [Candidatus Woesearchaeota archaeon]